MPARNIEIDKWMEKERHNHLCHCGCGCEIIIQRRYFWIGIPNFIHGHNSIGVNNPNYGKTMMKEQKKKISEANKNPSKEIRKRMSEAHKGKKLSEKTKTKISEKTKGENNHNYGKPISEEQKKKISQAQKGKQHSETTRKKMSDAQRGKKHYNYGKHLTDETKEKIQRSLKGKHNSPQTEIKKGQYVGKNHPMFGKNHSDEAKKKIQEARKKQKIPTHHTTPELIFEEICKKYNLPFHYVGDGSLWIGKERPLNPDFVEANGKKIIVEIFGDYWHSPLLNHKLPEYATLEYRKKHYKKYGWQSHFLWETDLKRPDAEQFVLQKLGVKNV